EKLTDILQQDALFLEYDENVSQAVLGAFRLPPIYVAKTTEYNRSTAETAKELTEEQVFQPLRESYAWRLNDLFKEYGFKYVEAYFKSPNLSNMDDIKAILSPAIQARAVAPNDLRDLLSKVLNKPLEDFEGEEYNLPTSPQTIRQGEDLGVLDISKAYGESESSEIAASIRRL
ncbi:phage portal protein, partial [Anaerotruncus sp. X29]|nr:phage portal protein [Anaerotruncus sp. X29]